MRLFSSGSAVKVASWILFAGTLFGPAVGRAETDWVLLLDRSESMTQNDPYNYRFDAENILVDLLAQGVGEAHRLTIIRFAGKPEVVLDKEPIRTETLEKIRKTISQDPPEGDTDIGAALALVRATVPVEGRVSETNVILLSDGVQAGKIENLAQRLEDEKRTWQELGLAVNAIILNDFSISEEDRRRRREQKTWYDDKTLRGGEDLLRDLARKTLGKVAQVRPGQSIEDILLELVAPRMSFHKQEISGRVQTVPTDRQLFFLFRKAMGDAKLRIGSKEIDVDLRKQQQIGGDFEITVNPYTNRTVVLLHPAESVAWPEWVDVLPGPSQKPVEGEVFAISNLRLIAVPGLGTQPEEAKAGVKTRIRENELYPVLFRITVPSDLSPDRMKRIQETLKQSSVRILVVDGEGKPVEQSSLPAGDVFAGTGKRSYLVPTFMGRGEVKVKEAFPLTVKASVEFSSVTGQRPLARAPDRPFVVLPSGFEWLVRRNWKGEPESSSRPLGKRDVEIELGQELRLEVVYSGAEALGNTEISASYSRVGESSARRLLLRDVGGMPRTFLTEWIFPGAVGEYQARVTVKSEVVQEVAYKLRIVRDDFRPLAAAYSAAGVDGAKGSDLGTFVIGEKIRFQRSRIIDRLSPELTTKYWESEGSESLKAALLRKDPTNGAWVALRQIPIAAEAPQVGAAQIAVLYRGEAADLEPGEYVIAWPEKRPLRGDPLSDSRSDVFQVLPGAFTAALFGEDGAPLVQEGTTSVALAGKKIIVRVAPTATFPADFSGEVTGTLTWARKDVGGPQVLKATKAQDGTYTLAFPTTDFHTGSAKLGLRVSWKSAGGDHEVEQAFDISSRPKMLSIAMEPVVENVLLGQRGASIRFRIRPVGGETPQAQKDLLSLWLSQPVNATLGDSEKVYEVNLQPDGENLVGVLENPGLPPGTYKLVVNSLVAKLGQDVAACFFNVRAAPYSARVLKSSSGSDQRVLLEKGVDAASCEGEGAAWVVVNIEDVTDPKAKPSKLASAELAWNGKKAQVRWTPQGDGGLESEPFPLEDLDRETALTLNVTDEAGKTYDLVLGTLTVEPMALRFEPLWTKAPPAELGRGSWVRIQGAVHVRGGSRTEREEARAALKASATPLLVVTPASVLQSYQLSAPAVETSGTSGAATVFGERVDFEAVLKVRTDDLEVKDGVLVVVRAGDARILENRTIAVGTAVSELILGRPGAQPGSVAPPEGFPYFARERLRVLIAQKEAAGKGTPRIQVFAPDAGTPAKPFASAEGKEFDWTAKKEGTYRVSVEIANDVDSGWASEELLVVAPPLKLEWAQDVGGSVKLDAGQYLPLFIKVSGPEALDWDGFRKAFVLRPQVIGEGGQALVVEFSPWESEKGMAAGVLSLKAFSTKPLSASASRVRVFLSESSAAPDASPLDVLDLDLVRGGGGIVVVTNFEKGPEGYALEDLVPGFQIPKGGNVRFGYRTASTLADATSLKNNIAATVIPAGGGSEKVLDVEAVSPELVVFRPYEAQHYGVYRIHLEIKGERTQLRQDPEFEVVKGAAQWAFLAVAIAAGVGLLIVLIYLGMGAAAYSKDKKTVDDRIRIRSEKAIAELDKEPTERLLGEVRLNVSGKTLGPAVLSGTPTLKDVSAWVEQHFSMDPRIFSDEKTQKKRSGLIESSLASARTRLLAQTEERLPVRGADVCVEDGKGGAEGASRMGAVIVQESLGAEHPGLKTLLGLRILEDGKIRASTPAGRSVSFGRGEDIPFNGWIGKNGNQIRASVKVPGIADYCTVTIDLK